MSTLAVAAANGQVNAVKELLEGGADPDALGPDGTSPLCAAALWGNDELVAVLLKGSADINVRNDGTKWTALHAAAIQEHGKVCHILLLHGAKTTASDASGCTPVDYASIAEAIWPFFAAKGAVRTSKEDLVRKGIIRKRTDSESARVEDDDQSAGGIKQLSRPGSAYVRVQRNPFANPYGGRSSSSGSMGLGLGGGGGGGDSSSSPLRTAAAAAAAGPGKPPVHPGK
jgi:hypothetical protein